MGFEEIFKDLKIELRKAARIPQYLKASVLRGRFNVKKGYTSNPEQC